MTTEPGRRSWRPTFPDRRAARVRRAELILCFGLLAQYLLGMAVNLFVKIPDDHPGANPPEYFGGVLKSVTWASSGGGLWLASHAGLGLLLVVVAFVAILLSFGSHSRAAYWSSIVGFLAIVGAGFNGGSFLNYAEDFSSMIMAALWAVALASYLAGIYRIGR
ncbi:hypothetical protein [Sinomonas sp. G460-2]|uniref:hypothetical protein n=1 Tax=Sinomonas sp. G460-2 TaxID=3393464 RepID=UPI0039F00C05